MYLQALGLLPGPAYHIELKEEYNPVRNPPHSVPVGMQDAYKAELEIVARGCHYRSQPLHRMGQLCGTSTET